MSFDGTIVKQPYELFPIDVDFAARLVVGETISTKTVTARDASTQADTSGTVLVGGSSISGTKIVQKVQAGAHGERHIVTFRIETSLANKYEADIQLTVRET